MSAKNNQQPPELFPDQCEIAGGIPVARIRFTCPFCGDRHKTTPIASIEVLNEWFTAGIPLGLFTAADAERLTAEARAMRLAENRTDFDRYIARPRPIFATGIAAIIIRF